MRTSGYLSDSNWTNLQFYVVTYVTDSMTCLETLEVQATGQLTDSTDLPLQKLNFIKLIQQKLLFKKGALLKYIKLSIYNV